MQEGRKLTLGWTVACHWWVDAELLRLLVSFGEASAVTGQQGQHILTVS